MRQIGLTRAASRAFLLMVLVLASACGAGEGGEGGGPTFSPTRTPTGTLPSITRTPDRSPDVTDDSEEPTTPEEPTTSEEPTTPEEPATSEEPTAPEEPTTEDSPTPTEEGLSGSATPESGETAGEAEADDEGIPSWVWWLLAALLLGAVAIPLLVRSRRRGAWQRELAQAEGELAWFARDLLPGLRHVGSREQAAGGWAVGQPRVAAAEDSLTVLETTAPDEAGRARARSLRDASRLARGRLQRLTGPGPHDRWALDLDEVIADLETALGDRPVRPSA